jgi:hypothetical protein
MDSRTKEEKIIELIVHKNTGIEEQAAAFDALINYYKLNRGLSELFDKKVFYMHLLSAKTKHEKLKVLDTIVWQCIEPLPVVPVVPKPSSGILFKGLPVININGAYDKLCMGIGYHYGTPYGSKRINNMNLNSLAESIFNTIDNRPNVFVYNTNDVNIISIMKVGDYKTGHKYVFKPFYSSDLGVVETYA